MRRLFILLVVLVLTACGGQVEPTAAPEPTEAPQQAEQPAEPTEIPQPTDTPAPTETTQPTATPEPILTPSPEPTETPQQTYLGDVIEQSGYLLSAVEIQDPATPGMFYEPQEGKRLVGVKIIVGNVDGDPVRVNPLNATLLDDEGFAYQPEVGTVEDQLATLLVDHGEKVRGWIGFVIPEDATPARIKYTTAPFGGEVLQTGLISSPEDHQASTEPLQVVPSPDLPALGETDEEHGYSLTATAVEDPAQPGQFYEPKEGTRLIAVKIVVGNIEGEMHTVNPLYAVLVDEEGYLYEMELGAVGDQLQTIDIDSGEKVKGWVAFEVPEGTNAASIKYGLGALSDECLQVKLTP